MMVGIAEGNSLFHAIDAIDEVRSSVGSQQRREFPSPFQNRMSEYIYIYIWVNFNDLTTTEPWNHG